MVSGFWGGRSTAFGPQPGHMVFAVLSAALSRPTFGLALLST